MLPKIPPWLLWRDDYDLPVILKSDCRRNGLSPTAFLHAG